MVHSPVALIMSMAKYVPTPELWNWEEESELWAKLGGKSEKLPEGESTGDRSAMVAPLGS